MFNMLSTRWIIVQDRALMAMANWKRRRRRAWLIKRSMRAAALGYILHGTPAGWLGGVSLIYQMPGCCGRRRGRGIACARVCVWIGRRQMRASSAHMLPNAIYRGAAGGGAEAACGATQATLVAQEVNLNKTADKCFFFTHPKCKWFRGFEYISSFQFWNAIHFWFKWQTTCM